MFNIILILIYSMCLGLYHIFKFLILLPIAVVLMIVFNIIEFVESINRKKVDNENN
jgi:hypothetical protein